MIILINPTITGGFVHHVMKDKSVSNFISSLKLSERDAHDFVKSILIVGTRDLNIDFKKKVDHAVDKILDNIEEG
jgi:hypothetical protein